jgi:hypothetical protein
MKAAIVATLLALAITPAAARAQATPATEIVVQGAGNVTLAPDCATVTASVQTASANAADAVGRNSAIYERVVAALAKIGIARADIALSAYNVSYNPKPPNEKPEPGAIYGYAVSRDFTVTVRDLAKAGAVVDASTQAGATSIGGVTFGLEDQHAAQAQATTRAVDDARTKAETLAAAAHLRVTGIKTINLGGGGGPVYPMARMAVGATPGAPTQLDSSNVAVSVTVEITFLAAP